MADSLTSVDGLPLTQMSERVNPADRSNQEKKENGFSEALRKKLKEKAEDEAKQDDVILEIEKDEHESARQDSDEQRQESQSAEAVRESDDDSGDDSEPPLEHIDLKV